MRTSPWIAAGQPLTAEPHNVQAYQSSETKRRIELRFGQVLQRLDDDLVCSGARAVRR